MTAPMSPPALSLQGFSYTYAGAAAPALAGVDLEIEPGELALIAGPSAGGKSTLLKTACGLVPHFHGGAASGTAWTAGLSVLETGPGELASVAGYLAQEPEAQVVSTTVEAEIAMGLELRGAGRSAVARSVEEVALALAIPHLLERTVDQLSGGELQRVALAAALAPRPQVILLDEPTSQLDPVAGDELIWLLRRLNAEWGVTVILAEHRLERCLAAADRVVAIAGGRIMYDGASDAFLGWAEQSSPALSTPAARMFSLAGIEPLPVGVRAARERLRMDRELTPPASLARREPGARAKASTGADAARENGGSGAPAATVRDLWVELGERDRLREVIRGLTLRIGAGERVALMGRNGAGKSTLLRAMAGLVPAVKGRIEIAGELALLTQEPGDYLIRERAGEELPGEAGAEALAAVGLTGIEGADPRDLSGGQRQRLALAIAMAGRMRPGEHPAVLALDEPTRGLDRHLKQDLAGLCRRLADAGSAVVIATHDVEFAATFASRVVLLGRGTTVADGDPGTVLSGGWYFATEVARVLDLPGAITPEQGARCLVSEELAEGAQER